MGAEDTPGSAVTVSRAGPDRPGPAREAVRGVHGRAPFVDGALSAFLADPSCMLLLAEAGGTVVGSLNGYVLRHPHRREPQFLLYEVDVREGWRRRGIGTRLVEVFVGEARRAGAFEVWVLTNASNAAAMALYRRCGFVRRHDDDAMLSLGT